MAGLINYVKSKMMLFVFKMADEQQMGMLLMNILHRYEEVYPNDDFIILTLPKNDAAERARTLDVLDRISDL